MTRAAIYARFSSDNQRDESIDAQVRLCREYAASRGYTVVKVYADEAITGRTDQRIQFQQLLSDAKAGLFDVVICDKVDRFARDRYDSAIHKRYLRKKCGVRLEYASQRIDPSPEGEMLEGVLEVLAEYFSANLARETMKGLTENALRGWFTGGVPPFGYKLATRTVDGKQVKVYDPDERAAPVVRRIFEMYAAGASYGDIQAATREDMIRLRGRPLSKNSIHDILRNEKYTGTFIYCKGTKHNHRHVQDDVIRVPDAFPAIVPRELWERVQEMMDKRKRHPGERARNKAREVYLLSGLIFCGKCGAALVGECGRGRTRKRYAYYECNRRGRTKECNLKTVRKDYVESLVLADIRRHIFSPEARARLREQFDAYLRERPREIEEQAKHITREIAAINRRIENILKNIEDGFGSAELVQRLRLLEEHREVLKSQLRDLEVKRDAPFSLADVEAMLDEAERIFTDAGDRERLKQVVRLFVERVTVYDEGVEIVLKIKTPPDLPGRGSDTAGSANGIRTRVSALRGRCPGPLDDSATYYGCGTRIRT